jgi:hypothetical protein
LKEKNETLGGIGMPGLNGKFTGDEDRQVPARHYLIKLTDSAPKVWETDARYLARVERPREASISGKMLYDDPSADEKAPATPAPAPSERKA